MKKSSTQQVHEAPSFPGKDYLLGLAMREDARATRFALNVTVLDYKPKWKKLFVAVSAPSAESILQICFNFGLDNLGLLRTMFTTPFLESPNDEEIHLKLSTGLMEKFHPELAEKLVPGVTLSLVVQASAYAGAVINDKTYNGFYLTVVKEA